MASLANGLAIRAIKSGGFPGLLAALCGFWVTFVGPFGIDAVIFWAPGPRI